MTQEEIDNLDMDQMQRLFELYIDNCHELGNTGSLSDFSIWMAER